MKTFLVTTVLSLTVACSSPTAQVGDGLVVRAAPLALKLTNQTPTPVYIFAIEQEAAARANWATCITPPTCTAIQAGQTITLPYTRISGYAVAGQEAIVYWWHLVPDGQTAFRPDSIRTVGVALK